LNLKVRPRKHRAEKKWTRNRNSRTKRSAKSTFLTFTVTKFHTIPFKNSNNYSYLKIKCIKESNDVELNPGPQNKAKDVINIKSYNVRGLKDFQKQKRLFNYLNRNANKSLNVINLQETHFNLKDIESVNYHWKWGSIHSPGVGAAAGVSILYNESFFDKIINSYKDINGRLCSFTGVKNDEYHCFINIYAPNNHNQTLLFLNELDNFMSNEFIRDSSTIFYVSGDFNMVLDENIDSIGRSQKNSEKLAVTALKSLMIKYKLVDSYRISNKWGGYTWGRDNPSYLRSRLDMILISKSKQKDVSNAVVNITPKESDHSWLSIEICQAAIDYGPGIVRCNSSLLNDHNTKQKVIDKLQESINEMPNDWNPHQKLDFIKVKIRDHLLFEGRIKAKSKKTNLQHTNLEIEKLSKKRDYLLSKAQSQRDNLEETLKLIDELTTSINIAEMSLVEHQREEADRLIFRSKVKWAEEGEKSTKYFMNLLKERQEKMQIRKIISNGITYSSQNEISKAITNFYKKLYQKQTNLTEPENSTLLENLPQLSEAENDELNKDLTLDELKNALNTCKESAPGLDGITYDTYRHLWEIVGTYILESWKYSVSIENTSPSQKTSVITLLEKKGKDPTRIENLRPISLSNCDIKICTKALAIRTSKILDNLLTATQTGYIPGRQVTDNSRLIEEIIEQCINDTQEGYLITLDAQKAFDSVDHNYLFKCLKAYNFSDKFITQIKTIYNNLNAVVMVNGYMTEKFNIEQSVKQGDALSCALFIIAMDPLLRNLDNNENIEPITINPGHDHETKINNASFADDITVICKNELGIQETINTYSKFSDISGVRLNIPKTEILVLGKREEIRKQFNILFKERHYVITSQDKVKICGITFSNNKDLAYNDNISEKIDKLERQLNIWRQRNLTLEGKILITKTFGISQLIYSLQSTIIRQVDIKRVENIIYRFIWNIPSNSTRVNGKISRPKLQSCKLKGGLKAPDIKSIDESIKYKFILRQKQNKHPVKKWLDHINTINSIDFNDIFIKKQTSSEYVNTCIKTHNNLYSNFKRDLEIISNEIGSKPHIYYLKTLANHQLKNCPEITDRQLYMVQNLRSIGITKLSDLKNNNVQVGRCMLERFQIWNSLPISWRKLINNSTRFQSYKVDEWDTQTISIGLNKWIQIEKLQTKQIYNRVTKYKTKETSLEVLNTKHNTNIQQDTISPFITCYKMTNNVRLRIVQFKILHNIYPTMKHLHTWGIKPSPNCLHCNVPETLNHAIWECEIAQQTLMNFNNLNLDLNIRDEIITREIMLFGKPRNNALNVILTLIKQQLILQRETKYVLTQTMLKTMIRRELKIEHIISLKTNSECRFNAKWHKYTILR
jgi:exonuclease III